MHVTYCSDKNRFALFSRFNDHNWNPISGQTDFVWSYLIVCTSTATFWTHGMNIEGSVIGKRLDGKYQRLGSLTTNMQLNLINWKKISYYLNKFIYSNFRIKKKRSALDWLLRSLQGCQTFTWLFSFPQVKNKFFVCFPIIIVNWNYKDIFRFDKHFQRNAFGLQWDKMRCVALTI